MLSADQCDRVGLTVPALAQETVAALAGVVPPLASTRNPVDFTPQAYLDPQWLAHFPRALDVIAGDAQIGFVFFQLGPMASGDVRMAEMVAAFRARCLKPALAAWPLMIGAARDSLQAQSMHVFPEYSRAVRAMGRLARYAEALRAPRSEPVAADFVWAAHAPRAAARRGHFGTSMPRDPCRCGAFGRGGTAGDRRRGGGPGGRGSGLPGGDEGDLPPM